MAPTTLNAAPPVTPTSASVLSAMPSPPATPKPAPASTPTPIPTPTSTPVPPARLDAAALADLDAKGEHRRTRLTLAVIEGYVGRAKALMLPGADVNGDRARGDENTLLHRTTGHGHTEIAEAFIAAGADVSAAGAWGSNPLNEAANGGHPEIVPALIEAGAGVNPCRDLHNPLHSPTGYRYVEIVNPSFAASADVNVADRWGSTPLNRSCRWICRDPQPIVCRPRRRQHSQREWAQASALGRNRRPYGNCQGPDCGRSGS